MEIFLLIAWEYIYLFFRESKKLLLICDDVYNFATKSATLVDFDVAMAKMVHNRRFILKITAQEEDGVFVTCYFVDLLLKFHQNDQIFLVAVDYIQ